MTSKTAFIGDTIGVVAPAGAPRDPARLTDGIAYLKRLGYRVECDPPILKPHGYLSGRDADRLEAFNRMLNRSDIRVLFCVRGGYGTLRLLPDLDYEAARRHPKLLVGYSDVTALHLALFRKAGWVGLSGPMVAVEWPDPDPKSEALFWNMIGGTVPYDIIGPGGEQLKPLRPGAAEGVLLGGNLTLITKLIGTPYLPSLDGAILFIEEVAEPPYRIDGMLAQLRLAGILDRLGGLVVGGLTGWEPDDPDKPTLSYETVLAEYTETLPCPVATGLVYGHFPVKNTMPVGVQARLTVTSDAATLTVLESIL